MPSKDINYHVDSVSEIIDEDYVSVKNTESVESTIDTFHDFDTEGDETTIYYIYITDESGDLVGVISFRELLNASNSDTLEEHMVSSDLITVNNDAHPEEATRIIAKHEFPAIPVVEDDELVGVLRNDDMIEIVEEEATEDILKQSGFSFSDIEESRSSMILESSISQILKLRLPWLVFALAGGLLAGAVIDQFEETLEAVVALAFFIPVIMDMGGNVGTQSSTIFVRGLALGQIDDKNAMKHFAREGLIGTLIGIIIGSIGAVAAYLWQINEPFALELAIVVFVGLLSVCIVASMVGYIVPWIMNKLGYDPAAASDPLITTIKDVTALIIYFGLATILLGHLL